MEADLTDRAKPTGQCGTFDGLWRLLVSEPLPKAGVAQLVEQLIRNQQVIGSSPIAGSNIDPGTSSPDP